MGHKEKYEVKSWRGGRIPYARMLRTVIDRRPTAPVLAKVHRIKADAARDFLRGMLALDLVHIGSTSRPKKGPPTARWHFGPGHSIEIARSCPKRPNAELIAFASMIGELQDRAHSVKTLAQATGIDEGRTGEFVAVMRDELKLVYVAAWDRGRLARGSPPAYYRFGIDKPSAPRPTPQTVAETCRAYKERCAARERGDAAPRAHLHNASIFNLAQAA